MQNSPPVFSKDKQAFFAALKELDGAAIRHLSEKLSVLIKSIPNIYLLQKEDIEELKNDAILVTLKKMEEGTFVFQDYDPVTYCMAVSRKLLANLLRKRKLDTVPIDNNDVVADFNPEKYLLQKETELEIGKLLKGLGENCEQVIRLKYYDNLRDQEVVNQKTTIYNTVDSLKNKRSQCLKKLAALVKEKGYSFSDLFKK
ncbi:MAG: hypothetical protein R2825_10660 [Saprospiraceae bacterium]